MTLEEFLDKVCQRPLPQNGIARIRTLAKELAEGASEGIWETVAAGEKVDKYLEARWNNNYPDWKILEAVGFIRITNYNFLTRAAFELLSETEPSTIFISYKRNESSPFALLVLKYLKEAGLEPFLDMALVPGEDWHDGLKERIQSRDYFILLLGRTTLKSVPVIKEIEWAMEKRLDVIPIWQPEFEFTAENWPSLSDAIKHKLTNTHTIRVLEENPTSYHTAMVELLNKFGITP